MIHHLIFTDTFFVDLVMPFYLLIDGLLTLNFYQPYANLNMNTASDLLLIIYGYVFSIIFLLKVSSNIDWKFNKQSLINNFLFLITVIFLVEISIFYICSFIALTEILSTFFSVESFLIMLLIKISSLVLLAPFIAVVGIGAYLVFKKVTARFSDS
jgi:hypothetical protein